MILIDANLLIYAIDADSPHHEKARTWLETTLSSDIEVGLAWGVVLAFLRITTHPKIVRLPLRPEQALSYIDAWLAQPYVKLIAPTERHWPILRNLFKLTGMAGNLTSDAHLAALALEHGYTLYSADHDFKRFPGLSHVNPLSA